MEEIIRARVYAKVINVIPDPRENCVARCHLKVGAERIEFSEEQRLTEVILHT